MPYAILKQRGDFSWAWAEMTDSGIPIAHENRAAAETRMAGMVPRGEDPLVYAGLRIEQIAPSNDLLIL